MWYTCGKMQAIVTLVTGLGLLAFGAVLIFIPDVSDDPYRKRKFGFAKASSTRLIFGAVALFMGSLQLFLWLGGHL